MLGRVVMVDAAPTPTPPLLLLLLLLLLVVVPASSGLVGSCSMPMKMYGARISLLAGTPGMFLG